MKTVFALAVVLVAGVPSLAAPSVEQVIELQPGWNSIYLEVRPEPNDIGSVFAGIPIESVWTWQPRISTVEFIRDPSEGLLNRPGWLGYFPPGPEEFLTNLHAVLVNRPYLVNVSAESGPVTLTVTGAPVVRKIDWAPNSYSLVGFPVDPGNPPTFGDFLNPSEAHRGQPIYRLDSAGQWVAAPPTERIRSGEAYWVYTRGASDFTAPIEIDPGFGDGLEYGALLNERTLEIRNLSSAEGSVVIRRQRSLATAPLCYWRLERQTDPEAGTETLRNAWPDLGSEHVFDLRGGEQRPVRLAIRRAELTSDEIEGVLEIKDGLGTRWLVPVSATKGSAVEGSIAGVLGAGLWVGNVVIDHVEEVRNDSTSPIPTGSEFDFRVILHSDGTSTKLLKQVYQMWHSDGQTGSYVLITDDDRLADFDSASMRDGEPVSYRISSVAYDFDGIELVGSGAPAPGGSVTFVIELDADAATNPFKHSFHPDHDNDSQASDIDGVPYGVTRNWTLAFAEDDPTGLDPPEWGDSVMGGTFSETLTGLHNQTIDVQGTFRLWRVSDDPELNPQG